jgi:hypothetical protein
MPFIPQQAPAALDTDGLRKHGEEQFREVARAWTEIEASIAANVAAIAANTTAITTLQNNRVGRVLKQVFTASGTYTPTAGMLYAIIDCVGGGGGGGGVAGAASGCNGGGGGGGGGFARKFVTAADIGASKTVTVGGGGNAGAAGANAGTAGGDTSVGVLCIGKGGSPGSGVTTTAAYGVGGPGGVAGTGDFTVPGQVGGYSFYSTSAASIIASTNNGGSSGLGFGAGARTAQPGSGNFSNGATGANYGGGGSGGMFFNVASNAAGGAGAPGIVVVTEFCTA